MTQVSIFDAPLPAHVQQKSKAMDAMAGGLAGGGFGNRISLRNSKFRLIQNGSDVGVVSTPYLDVVIFALSSAVQRLYYEGAYDPDSKEAPTCFSHDGISPSPESAKVQNPKCGTCAQNVKGSGRMPGTKACAYKKRVVLASSEDIEGPTYALDISGQSMFGEQLEGQNKFSFKGYYEKLMAHSVSIDAIVTRMTFDDAASVPKLHFTPLRALTEEEYAQVTGRGDDPEVQKMLKDLINIEETTPQPKAQPKAVAAPKEEVKAKGVGGLVSDPPKKGKGFATQSTPPQTETITIDKNAGVQSRRPMTVDLEALKSFDN